MEGYITDSEPPCHAPVAGDPDEVRRLATGRGGGTSCDTSIEKCHKIQESQFSMLQVTLGCAGGLLAAGCTGSTAGCGAQRRRDKDATHHNDSSPLQILLSAGDPGVRGRAAGHTGGAAGLWCAEKHSFGLQSSIVTHSVEDLAGDPGVRGRPAGRAGGAAGRRRLPRVPAAFGCAGVPQ